MISKEQFLEFFRSDSYNEQLTADECQEVFLTALKGASDITEELFQQVADEYDAGVIVTLSRCHDWPSSS